MWEGGRGEDRGGGRKDGPGAPRGPRPALSHKAPLRNAPVVFLHEDEDLVAVDKPAGLAVIAPEGSRGRNLLDLVTEHIRKKNPKGRAAVVHRIDRDTSGLLVFAKNARAKTALMSNWDALVLERRYVALVSGEMGAESGRFDSWLAENRGGEVYVAEEGTRGAKRAITNWRLLGSGNGFSLLELELETGRKNQIRVQLSFAGHSVCGDSKYGRGLDPLGRLCLHAATLVLTHPFTKERLVLHSETPPEFALALRERGSGKAVPPRAPGGRSRRDHLSRERS